MAVTSVEDNGQPAQKSAAVFQRYGNRYFLSGLDLAGKSRHVTFSRPSRKSNPRSRKTRPPPQTWR